MKRPLLTPAQQAEREAALAVLDQTRNELRVKVETCRDLLTDLIPHGLGGAAYDAGQVLLNAYREAADLAEGVYWQEYDKLYPKAFETGYTMVGPATQSPA